MLTEHLPGQHAGCSLWFSLSYFSLPLGHATYQYFAFLAFVVVDLFVVFSVISAQIMEGRPSPVPAPAYGAEHWNTVSLFDKIHILLWVTCLDSENGIPPRVPELGARIWRCARQFLDTFERTNVTLCPQPTKKRRRR